MFNLFASFLLLFICLAVDCFSSSNNLSGLGVGGDKVGGGGGGLLGLGGLVLGTAGAGGGGVACAVSKAVSSAFLNLEYLFNPLSFARAFSSGIFNSENFLSILYM